jgi:hypothetical protein
MISLGVLVAMLSLSSADEKFKTKFQIIENGVGVFRGVMDDPTQSLGGASSLLPPRNVLRVERNLPIRSNMVIQSEGGTVYLLGHHGVSEGMQGVVFRSFLLLQALRKFHWQRPFHEIEPLTQLKGTEGLKEMTPPFIWGTYEPLQEQFDRELHISSETGRFITNQPIQMQDRIDGRNVVRVDQQLGLYIATLG